jgi:hypothetical protein
MANAVNVSLLNLIVTPDKYDGQWVRVLGFCSLAFEDQALWVSKEDLRYHISKNAIWLSIKATDELRKLDRKYVRVEGKFVQGKLGHLNRYSGTIEDITRIALQPAISNTSGLDD